MMGEEGIILIQPIKEKRAVLRDAQLPLIGSLTANAETRNIP